MNIAIIDIGTNTAILLIAHINPDKSYQILHDECRIVRLGEGIHHNNAFLDKAMERTFAALKDYKAIMDKYDCQERVLIGTASFRNAKNSDEFMEKVSAQLGLKIEIISGKDEAHLIHQATIKDFEHLQKPLLTLDIGGGSTEFIFDDDTNTTTTSLSFGSVKLTEQFLHTEPPTKKEITELTQFIQKNLTSFNNSKFKTQNSKLNLVATAGTPTTLYALNIGLNKYDPEKVHGHQMSKEDLQQIMQKLEELPLKERCKIPCLPTGRADVIIAGSYILKTVLDYFELDHFWISDRGLRYGILYDTFLI